MVQPTSVSNAELVTHLCGPADRAEQAELFSVCFRKALTADDLAWRYDRGPHGRAVSLLARPPGGTGICGYACTPRKALAYGEERTLASIGQTGDVMTHPDWRKRGIFSDLDRTCMRTTRELGWPLAFGLPNRRSAPIFLELGWQRVGVVRPWSFLLKADAAARQQELREGRLRSLLTGWNALRCRLARRGAPGLGAFAVRELERFPDEVEALSREVEKRHALMVRRDADYLDWRFRDAPSGFHTALGLYDANRLAGYVVVQRPRPEDGVGYLVDLLAPAESAVFAAVEAGLQRLEAAGASVVRATAVDGSWWSGILRRAGFLPPREENHLIVIAYTHRPEHPLAQAAGDASRWYLTDGDRDDETMG